MAAARLLALLLAALAPTPALPGAWARGEGEVFLSFTTTGAVPEGEIGETAPLWDRALYLEIGVTERLTFGLDAYSGADGAYATTLAFVRSELGPLDAAAHVALDAGLARVTRPGAGDDLALRLGLSWGRGGTGPWGGHWVNVDANLLTTGPDLRERKLDATFGIKPTERTMLILQLQSSRAGAGPTYVRGVGSVVQRLTPALALEVGLSAGLAEVEETGLRLGTWLEF